MAAVEQHREALLADETTYLLWQTGARYYDRLRERVPEHPRQRLVKYVERMDLAYAAADLALCRAGAITCSELMVTGTPAVLVPRPETEQLVERVLADSWELAKGNRIELFGLAELISVGRARDRARAVLSAVDRQLGAQLAQRRIEAAMNSGLAAAGYAGFWIVFVIALGLYADGVLSAPVAAAVALVSLHSNDCSNYGSQRSSGSRWRRAGAFSKPAGSPASGWKRCRGRTPTYPRNRTARCRVATWSWTMRRSAIRARPHRFFPV